MFSQRASVLCGAFFLLCASVFAEANFTGTWSGNFSGTVNCSDVMVPATGTATAQLVESGTAVSGTLTITAVSVCTATVVVPLAGTVSGSTATFNVTSRRGSPLQIVLTVNGSSLGFNVSGATSVMTGTLTQTSSATPDSTYSGTYTGTYNYSKNATCSDPNHPGCTNLTGTVTSTGTFDATIFQTGTAASASFLLHNVKDIADDGHGNCTIVTRDEGGAFAGTMNGNTLTIQSDNDMTTVTFNGGSLTGSGSGGNCATHTMSLSGTRTSSGTPAPAVLAFTATPQTVAAGVPVTLSWSTANATGVSIGGIGAVPANGTISAVPLNNTTYTLTATGIGGSTTATTSVTVTGTGPRVAVSKLPSGMLEAAGQSGAGDSFAIANVGTDLANVSIAANGAFFTVTPSSLTLPAQSTQSITLTASGQPAGSYDGTVTVTGNGTPSGGIVVPVHLLVAAVPNGTVSPKPAAGRVDVSAPAAQNPTGAVSFTNSGTAAMNGIALADVPWIVPQSGVITMNPGETKSVSFSIDRSQRPDAGSLSGGATGTLSLRYFGGSADTGERLLDTTPTSTVSVSIVDAVKPDVASGTPPALQQGELALFITGLASTTGLAGDLFLSNFGASTLNDLKLYFPAGSQVASLAPLASNLGISLPSISQNVFNVSSGQPIMVRGSSLGSIAATAMRFANPAGANLFATAQPVFRSDRAVKQGGKIVLSGVEPTPNTATIVIIQEVSGNATTADIQPYDANGAPIGTKTTVSINPFRSGNDGGTTVVAGTRTVVVANTGAGAINAFARTTDQSTGDSWVVTDPSVSSGSTGPFIVPMLSISGAPAETDVYVTNTSGAPVNATMTVATPAPRRRSIRSESIGSNGGPQQLTIGPLQTQKSALSPADGYVVISGPAGAIAASARVTLTSAGSSYGSALPVLAAASSLANGQAKRFTGVEDSSRASAASRAPATFRTTLGLVETAGQSATVRVTLWYTLPAGALVTAQVVSSKTFVVPASQMVVVNDLARSVIGAKRDSYGDLHDVQVDVQVIDGGGAVLPVLQSIDNHSGDVVVRSE